MKNKNIVNNTIMLMIFNIAKIVFPFITLPYLTRILTTDSYGIVAYVKTVMSYMQIFVDFGFVLSATKDIVKCREDKNEMERVIGDTMVARVILGGLGFVVVLILSLALPILRTNILYTMLSYVAVFLSIFLMDFLFRGLERMHVITIRFIVMKIISTIFTFVLIKGDQNLILIPILDIVSTLVAILMVWYEIGKMQLKLKFSEMKKVISTLKDSFVYFLSNVAATSLNALSTIIIGIYTSPTEVAYWSLCMQIIGSITACYNPISDGIYPEMIKTKNTAIIKKVLKIFMPIVLAGCIFSYFFANIGFMILGGEKYSNAVPVFRLLIPTLFFGFPAIIFGWPTLGAIGKAKETTVTTIIAISVYIIYIVRLIVTKSFTITNIAIGRSITEMVLFGTRYWFYRKYKSLFNENTN